MTGDGALTPDSGPARRGLRAAIRRHPWRTAAVLGGSLLTIAAALLFNPDLQQRWLLPKLMPLAAEAGVQRLDLDYLHLTPWSVNLRGLHANVRGMELRIGTVELDFNPFGLLTDTIIVHELRVPDATVDLTRFVPGPPSAEPFPGVLHLLDAGYGVALYDVAITAYVQLAATRRVHAEIRADEVRPHVGGALNYEIAYAGDGQQVDAEGSLQVEQLSGGRFRALRSAAVARITADALPAPERVAVALAVTPAPGTGHARAVARERRRDGILLPPSPEALTVTVELRDAADATRAKLEFAGLYRGDDGSLRGEYQLQADNGLVVPYTGEQPLPGFALTANGALGLETMSGGLDLTADATTRLTDLARVLGANPALPAALSLHSAATLALQGGRLALTRFEHALSEPVAGVATALTPLVALKLQPPLVAELDAPDELLASPRVFGTLSVSQLPLPWFDGLLSGHSLVGGTLDAAFDITADDEGRLQVLPLIPLSTGVTTVRAGEDVLVPALRLTAQPRLTWSAEQLRLRVAELAIESAGRRLAGGKLVVTQPSRAAVSGATGTGTDDAPAAAVPASLTVTHELDADVDALRALPPLAARRDEVPLPDALRLATKGSVERRGGDIIVASLRAALAQPAHPELLTLVARQPFVVPQGDTAFTNPRGELATLTLRGFELAWINAFVPTLELRGALRNADLLLTAPADGRYAVTATAPLRLDGVHARFAEEAQVSALDIVATPRIDYSPQRVRFEFDGLEVSSGAHSLVRGDLSGTVPLQETAEEVLAGEGSLRLDLTRLAAQPALRRALDRAPPDLDLTGDVDFAASRAGDLFRIARLAVDLRADGTASLQLAARDGLEVRPTLRRDEQLARHVVGEVTLGIRALSSAIVERFVPLEGMDFAAIDADLRLRSDGASLHLDSAAPLRVEQVRMTADDAPLLAPFSVGTRATVDTQGRQFSVDLADFALNFDGNPKAALAGHVAATVAPDRTVPLLRLDTEFAAQLPQWLSQPAVMPGHKLSTGVFGAKIAVTEDGAITARAALDGLAASAPLAIAHIELPVTGRMAPDGRGFSFTAPLSAEGRSGVSNAAVEGRYAPEPDKRGLLRLGLDSAVFYLNDLLATLAAVAPARAAPTAAAAPASSTAPATPVALDSSRDSRAAWDVLPYGTELSYHIGKLYYTDYLAFDEVTGKLTLRKRRLAATDVAARFHDSPLALDGTLDFREEAAEPYLLKVDGTVKDFNLNQFFKELVPGERPRIKGLFSVDLEAGGTMPNLGQLRNATLFDIRMKSRKGVFRPLPPSSTLLVGTSDMLGLVGEGLSYVPTGGFGAGTIARLVNYIARIDYDIVDIRVRRAETRDVVIERFLVRSPTISMTAAGGITHAAGKDIVDSPLDLRANLDMSGRGAAILYSMGLLRDERNDAGYWRGPEFKIWGTPAASESNFADIIRQASDGTVKGGITRPLSGLIGNLKYRWFGDKPQPLPPELAEEVEALEAETREEE